MTVMIFGSKGFLGKHFLQAYPDALTPSADITDIDAINIALMEYPDIVINVAGKTGRPNVDWCESHKNETFRSNAYGPFLLQEACEWRGIYFVHVSSGCIYDGSSKQFTEEDEPNFYGSFYARTKIISDQYLTTQNRSLVLRVRMPFDDSLNERTLIGKLSKYENVLDVKNSLTYIPDFIAAAKLLIGKRCLGVFNVVNPGAISPYEVMQMYAEIVDPSHKFNRLTVEELSNIVLTGRSNCVLSTAKLRHAGAILPDVVDRVQQALEKIKLASAL